MRLILSGALKVFSKDLKTSQAKINHPRLPRIGEAAA
jgi:hypothetical protein